MRLLADENLPKPIMEALRAEGHDILWARTELAGTTDVALLDRAEVDACAILFQEYRMAGQRFSIVSGIWAVSRLPPDSPVPVWAFESEDFVSITRTREELSVVCPASAVPAAARSDGGWALLKLHGPFSFDQVGILSSFVAPLAGAGISVFAVSTFDTDYVLVKAESAARARDALIVAGHEFVV